LTPLLVVAIADVGAARDVAGAQQETQEAGSADERGPGSYDHALAPVANALRADTPIDVDGVLDEPAWSDAEPITDLLQTEPFEGNAVSEGTEVRVVYRDDAIYVGARLRDRSPVTTRLARRDSGLGDSDSFSVLLDSFHDHATAYRFWTNPSGVKGDAIVTGNGTGGGDSSWDPIWDLATEVTADGWIVEMRIPFSQLRFGSAREQVWGVQVERHILRQQETASFPFTPRLERAGASRFAHLHGIEGIEPGRRLEMLPYVVARGEYLQLASPAAVGFENPYRSGSDHFGGVGLDLKYRLTSNVTLDATVNPDFGQVELDPSVINLTAFETRFSERRPFFVEGADIFDFGEGGPTGSVGRPPQMLYSRRIGRSPTGSAPSSAVFSDEPTSTTILGAAKVTGRFGDGWSLGLLEAVTADESAAYVDASRQPGEVGVEPAANYLVGRARRQLRSGATRFGLIGTAMNRAAEGSDLANRLHGSAYSGGFDFAHETTDRGWMFSGLVAGSRVSGSADAIERTQRSSARYFHRPDARHLDVDPLATSMSGLYAMGFVGKQAGTITMRNGFAWVSPGFETNDLGFQSLSDRIYFDTHYQYNDLEPGPLLRTWNVSLSPDAVWNSAGEQVLANVNSNLNFEFLNYWRLMGRVQLDAETADDRLTRGGPMARSPGGYSARLNVTSDTRRPAVLRASYNWGSDDGGGWNRSVDMSVSARLRETVRLSFGPSYSWAYATAQYVTRIADPLAGATFGFRYVFADLDRSTLSLETSLDVTFTPTLSLQLYVEPFVSVGDYDVLKEFSAPDAFDFLTYGDDVGTVARGSDGSYDVDPDGAGPAPSFVIADRDFSHRSLLGNAVLRWEWRPGSTLFLVWQQRRINALTGPGPTGADPWVGSFDLGRDVDHMFGVAPDNVLMIKVNYWVNP
jgi:hypothetical protein